MNTWPNPQEWSLGPLGRGAMLVNGRRIDPSPAHTYTQSPALSTHTNTHTQTHTHTGFNIRPNQKLAKLINLVSAFHSS